MPPPPASLEAGPNTPQPSPNVAWTPGYWVWRGSSYAWRPGFWAAVQPNWIWMPPHYVWTPSGYLFVAGYWDLPVANRGLMFAPVYYPQPVYAQPGFAFTPSISIVGSAVTANLFVPASTNQYLFGNYYAQNYRQRRDRAVVLVQLLDRPATLLRPALLVLRRGQRAAEPAVDLQVREEYVLRRENVAMRPPIDLCGADPIDRAKYHDRSQRRHAAQQDGRGAGHATRARQRSRATADTPAGCAVTLNSASSVCNRRLRRSAGASGWRSGGVPACGR